MDDALVQVNEARIVVVKYVSHKIIIPREFDTIEALCCNNDIHGYWQIPPKFFTRLCWLVAFLEDTFAFVF